MQIMNKVMTSFTVMKFKELREIICLPSIQVNVLHAYKYIHNE